MSRGIGVLLLAAAVLPACGEGAERAVRVLAASSLTGAFEVIGERFEQAHPDVEVEFSFAASSELAAQIEQGAVAEVLASADEVVMDRVVDNGDVRGAPTAFARNELAIAVEPGNPEEVASLADLGHPDLLVAWCAPQVPCGRLADDALRTAGVNVRPVTRTENVTAAAGLVALGEVDAAVVYTTDVATRDDVEAVTIPAAENVVTTYPVAVLREAESAVGAREFVDFVLSARGQRVLRSFGFLAP